MKSSKAELDRKPGGSGDLLDEIRRLVEDARRQAAAAVNVGLTALYGESEIGFGGRFYRMSALLMASRLSPHCRDN